MATNQKIGLCDYLWTERSEPAIYGTYACGFAGRLRARLEVVSRRERQSDLCPESLLSLCVSFGQLSAPLRDDYRDRVLALTPTDAPPPVPHCLGIARRALRSGAAAQMVSPPPFASAGLACCCSYFSSHMCATTLQLPSSRNKSIVAYFVQYGNEA